MKGSYKGNIAFMNVGVVVYLFTVLPFHLFGCVESASKKRDAVPLTILLSPSQVILSIQLKIKMRKLMKDLNQGAPEDLYWYRH